jgi:hypothetical protein
LAQRFVAPRRGAITGRSVHRDRHKTLEHLGDLGRGQAEVAVPALLLKREEPGSGELAQVRARRLRRDPSGIGELAGGQRSAGHQGQEHVRSRWIPNQRSDFGNEGPRHHAARIALIRDARRTNTSVDTEAIGRDSVADPGKS